MYINKNTTYDNTNFLFVIEYVAAAVGRLSCYFNCVSKNRTAVVKACNTVVIHQHDYFTVRKIILAVFFKHDPIVVLTLQYVLQRRGNYYSIWRTNIVILEGELL